MGETFGPISKTANDQSLRSSHSENIRGEAFYGTNSDLGSTFTIQRPELMSGT